jgi:hypothetical protein
MIKLIELNLKYITYLLGRVSIGEISLVKWKILFFVEVKDAIEKVDSKLTML